MLHGIAPVSAALLVVLLASPAQGQGPDTLALSLAEAVDRAVRLGDEARLAGAQVDVAEAQVLTARASGLPQLRLAGTFSHVYENARAQAVGSIFNQPNTYNMNANLSQTVFQGGRVFAGARAASRLREASRLTEAETRAQITFDVQAAYLQVLFANRMLEIQTATYERAQAHLKEVEQFEGAGRSARYDVLRARVELANLEPAVIQARNDRDVAELNLKRLTNVPFDRPLVLTTTIDSSAAEAIALAVAAEDNSPEDRPSLRAAELIASAREQGVKAARADFLPTVSIYFQTGYQAFPFGNRFPPGMGRIISEECPPDSPAGRSCITHNGGWFSDRSMGVQISWPIFDGLRAKGNYDLAQAQARVANVQLAQERERVALEIAQARAEFERARALFAARRQNTSEAAEALRLAELRYARGLSTALEVSDARIAALIAETNEARAVYDYYLAAADLARALGEPIPLPGSTQDNNNPRDDEK